MSSFKVSCPQCGDSLRSSRQPKVGKRVDCPLCAQEFQIRAEMIQTSSATAGSIHGVMLDELLAGPAGAAPAATPISAASPPRPAPAMGLLETPKKRPSPPRTAPPPARTAAPAPPPVFPQATPQRAHATTWILASVGGLLVAAICLVAYIALTKKNDAPDKPGADPDLLLASGSKTPKDDPALKKTDARKEEEPKDKRDADPVKEPIKLVVKEEPKDSAKDAVAKVDPKTDLTKPETPKVDPPKGDEKPDGKPVLPDPVKEDPKKDAPIFAGPATPGLPGVEPERINRAVLAGAGFLKSTQLPTGTWNKGGHSVGYAALGGLTLLECRFPAKDPSIQAAANFVRANSLKLDQTYDLSLAVLFLDRLGESKDKVLIHGLALRLVAGQNDKGGWDYRCPLLNPSDMHQLITYLQRTKQRVALQLPRKDEPDQPPSDIKDFQPLNQEPDRTQPGDQPADQKDKDQPGKDGKQPDKGGATGSPPGDRGKEPEKKEDMAKKEEPMGTTPKILPKGSKPGTPPVARPDLLPPSLRDIPAVVAKGKGKGAMRKGRDDNSNTQFALLALWAARRHGVPTEVTLQLSGARFQSSQNGDGGWGYDFRGRSTNSMTCVGLLGLAMDIGSAPELPKTRAAKASAKPILDNAQVDKGLLGLAGHIGAPSLAGRPDAMQNLYFLWSVERVAMMYGLSTIGGKDWYGWGAQILVAHQNANGSWTSAKYPGHGKDSAAIDTCFALLFLKRSNLADDLTRNFQHFLAIRDPGAKEAP